MNASELIDQDIASYPDWRGERLKKLRQLISQASSELTEDWKWNTPVWVGKKPVVAIAAFKEHIKINFFKGALLADKDGIFNSGLEAKLSRGIDLKESDQLDEAAFQALVRLAAAYDLQS